MNSKITIPDGVSGDWRVESFEVTEQESKFSMIRAMQHPEEYVLPGKYQRLMRGGTVVMSDTRMEMNELRPIKYSAKGNVLLNGLGLGVCLRIVLQKPEVLNVTVIEKSLDVINLVGNYFNDSRVSIVNADAFEWIPPKGVRYDAVWHDIWDDMCSDNLKEMTQLKRKYSRKSDWQGCWSESFLRYRCRM